MARPTTIPASNVPTSDRSRPISAAASDEMIRKVSVTESSATRSESRSPAAPAIRPEPNQATASTRRTGTPSVDVISRSSASARIAVPSFVNRRNTLTARVTATPNASPMIWVQVTSTFAKPMW